MDCKRQHRATGAGVVRFNQTVGYDTASYHVDGPNINRIGCPQHLPECSSRLLNTTWL